MTALTADKSLQTFPTATYQLIRRLFIDKADPIKSSMRWSLQFKNSYDNCWRTVDKSLQAFPPAAHQLIKILSSIKIRF